MMSMKAPKKISEMYLPASVMPKMQLGCLPLLEASDAGEALMLSFAGGWTVATSAEPAMFAVGLAWHGERVMRASIRVEHLADEASYRKRRRDGAASGTRALRARMALGGCDDGGSDMCGDGGRRKKKEEGEVAR